MDNNTKAKVLRDGLIWCPLFLIHHKQEWERPDKSNKESGKSFFLKYGQNMLNIFSLICWDLSEKSSSSLLLKYWMCLQKVVKTPGVNSFWRYITITNLFVKIIFYHIMACLCFVWFFVCFFGLSYLLF